MSKDTQLDPEHPLSAEKTLAAKALEDRVLDLCEGKTSTVIINALVNALANVAVDAILHAGFQKDRIIEHFSKAIDFHKEQQLS